MHVYLYTHCVYICVCKSNKCIYIYIRMHTHIFSSRVKLCTPKEELVDLVEQLFELVCWLGRVGSHGRPAI